MVDTYLPPLPLEEWEPTKDTLHLWAQIIGKTRLGLMPMRNHWWNATLYPSDRFLRILQWSADVLEEFAGWYCGKSSPVHLFWYGFDLATSRFSGTRADARSDVDAVTAEAYSHEVISFGFWAGDKNNPFPAYYSYTAPEPGELPNMPLRSHTYRDRPRQPRATRSQEGEPPHEHRHHRQRKHRQRPRHPLDSRRPQRRHARPRRR